MGEAPGLDAQTQAFRDSQGHVHLVRDAIGHDSLYWGRRADGELIWGSRVHDVLGAGAPRTLDLTALATFLSTAYVPGTATLAAGIRAVPAGSELIFDGPGAPREQPFAPLPASPPVYRAEEELRASLRAVLEATVDRLHSGGPAAATLSGGIDSSLVAALVRRRSALTTLSIAFGPEHRSELEWSGLVASHIGARHEVIVVRPEHVIRHFDAAAGALSEPNGDPLTVPNLMLFEAARELGLGQVFNGEGGDPCFGGPKNAPLLLSQVYGERDARWPRERAYLRAHQRLWDELDMVLEPDVRAQIPDGALEGLVTPWLDDARWPSFLDRLMAINVSWKGAGHILPKVEHLGARAGVRPRSPLFDRHVVWEAFAIPAELKRRGPIEKYLLKEAVRDLLPGAVVDRPKSGMMVPVEAWFDGPLQAFARERLLDGLAPRRIVQRAYLERLLARQHGGLRPRRGVKIWLLLTLEAWLRCVLDGKQAP